MDCLPLLLGRRPAGLQGCSPHERARWVQDEYRYPPYQYRDDRGLWDKKGNWRLPSVEEKEALMGFPVGYTRACMVKSKQKSQECLDKRHRLLGNSWQVGVVGFGLGIASTTTRGLVQTDRDEWSGFSAQTDWFDFSQR